MQVMPEDGGPSTDCPDVDGSGFYSCNAQGRYIKLSKQQPSAQFHICDLTFYEEHNLISLIDPIGSFQTSVMDYSITQGTNGLSQTCSVTTPNIIANSLVEHPISLGEFTDCETLVVTAYPPLTPSVEGQQYLQYKLLSPKVVKRLVLQGQPNYGPPGYYWLQEFDVELLDEIGDVIHTCATNVTLNHARYYDISCGDIGVVASSIKIRAKMNSDIGLNGIAILGYDTDCSDPTNIEFQPDEWAPALYTWCTWSFVEVSVSTSQIGCTYQIQDISSSALVNNGESVISFDPSTKTLTTHACWTWYEVPEMFTSVDLDFQVQLLNDQSQQTLSTSKAGVTQISNCNVAYTVFDHVSIYTPDGSHYMEVMADSPIFVEFILRPEQQYCYDFTSYSIEVNQAVGPLPPFVTIDGDAFTIDVSREQMSYENYGDQVFIFSLIYTADAQTDIRTWRSFELHLICAPIDAYMSPVELTYQIQSGSQAISFGDFVVEPNCGYSFESISPAGPPGATIDYIDCNFDSASHFENSFYECNIFTTTENLDLGGTIVPLQVDFILVNTTKGTHLPLTSSLVVTFELCELVDAHFAYPFDPAIYHFFWTDQEWPLPPIVQTPDCGYGITAIEYENPN